MNALPAEEVDRSPRAFKSNVDKPISCRFKKWGMSWMHTGADCICQIIELKENGELVAFLSKWSSAHQQEAQVTVASFRREVKRNPDAWLKSTCRCLG